MSTGNRQYKNNFFVHYFSDKERLIEAYNAIAETDYPPDTDIEFLTLENVLFRSGVNDLAFIIEGRCIVLIEHQSTVNENMPLRMLMYIADIYRGNVDQESLYCKDLHKIPTPEFFVVYNGLEEYPDMKVLRLSDAFMSPAGEQCMELLVPVYNITDGHNEELLKRCTPLSDYAEFVSSVRAYQKKGCTRKVAINKTIHDFLKNGKMVEYLKKESDEVRKMLIMEWDDEVYAKVMRDEGREEERKESEKRLEKERKESEKRLEKERKESEKRLKESALLLKEVGTETARIVEATGLSEKEVEAL